MSNVMDIEACAIRTVRCTSYDVNICENRIGVVGIASYLNTGGSGSIPGSDLFLFKVKDI